MTTTAEHIAAIRKALEAGPTPGEWGITENTGEDEAYCDWHDVGPFSLMGGEADKNSRFVSACNPVAMTAVLAEIDRLKTENERMREALKKLLDRDERNTCQHENTKRGGFIWTICEDCGAQWADDRGGKPQWKDPDEWAIARAALLSPADTSPAATTVKMTWIEEGIERAARYIEKQRDEYVQEFGMYDPSTGVTEFSNGGEEHLSTLEELIDGIRARAAAPKEATMNDLRIHQTSRVADGIHFDDLEGFTTDQQNFLASRGVAFVTEFEANGCRYGGIIVAQSQKQAEDIAFGRGLGERVLGPLSAVIPVPKEDSQ